MVGQNSNARVSHDSPIPSARFLQEPVVTTTERTTSIPKSLGLKVSDWIIVRSKEEILSTLDEKGCLDGLPFQPEMFAFCGRRMRVAKTAHKTCDNITRTGGRSMTDSVHLEAARCNGALHGGCQADCVFFWKESWLRREDQPSARVAAARCTEADVMARVRAPGEENSEDPTWVCQTTKIHEASELLHWWDVRQYIRDVTSGNHTAWAMIKLLTFAGYRKLVGLGVGYSILVEAFNKFQSVFGGKPFPSFGDGQIPDGKPTPHQVLDLKPGEWVEIKSPEEIMTTLNRKGFNRGMKYTNEMLQYSGEQHRVEMRVDRLISEETGKMLIMKGPCIQIEDVYCRAVCTDMRIGCPRASNTYWREIWLKRIPEPANQKTK